MVIVIKTGTPEAAIRQLLAQLAAQNVKGGCVAGPNGILLPLVGDTWRLDPNMLKGLPLRAGGAPSHPRLSSGGPRRPPCQYRGCRGRCKKSVKNSA